MRTYKIRLITKDYDNPNEVNHYSEYKKEISEELFNSIYKLIC